MLLIVRWSNTIQIVGTAPVLPIPEGHPADPVAVYADLLTALFSAHPNRPLLAMSLDKTRTVITISMLVNALRIVLDALHLDTSLYLLYILQRSHATSAYQPGIDQIDIKCHGL